MSTEINGVVELRQYALQPGTRDDFVELFARHLVAPQEDMGLRVLGCFRDLDDPDTFTWLRGFPDMAARKRALETFYTSDIWFGLRDTVNAHIVDHTNVLLLRPSHGWAPGLGPGRATEAAARGVVVTATIWPLREPASPALMTAFNEEVAGHCQKSGASVLGLFVTEPSANDYPRLPVREGENVIVLVARHANGTGPVWDRSTSAVAEHLAGDAQTLRLAPVEGG